MVAVGMGHLDFSRRFSSPIHALVFTNTGHDSLGTGVGFLRRRSAMTCLATLLPWLDLHPSIYFLLGGGLVIAVLGYAVISFLRAAADNPKTHDWGWGALIVLILAVGRWPSLAFAKELNADESQFLAGAHALVYDPVFWRATDVGTSGPLNVFALWPAGWLLGWQTYLTARCTAFVLVALALVLTHQCLSLVAGRRVARVSGLAGVTLEALTSSGDLSHYSSELLPVALLTAATYFAIRRWFHNGGLGSNGWGGLLLGAVPLAKLQGAPQALALGLLWVIAEFRSAGPDRTRRLIYLIGSALVPVVLFASQVLVAGEWQYAKLSYFTYNLYYTGTGTWSLRDQLLVMLANSLAQDSLLHLWMAGSLLWAGSMIRWRLSPDRATRTLVVVTLVAMPLVVWSVIQPGHPFLHYWQFIIVPGSLTVGALAANLLSVPPPSVSRRWLVAGGAVALVGLLLVSRALNPPSLIGTLSDSRAHPRSALSARVLALAQPGDKLAVWGHSAYLHVETGLAQATRQAVFDRAVDPGPYQEYFRERFLADLMYTQPAFFVDSVGISSLHYRNRRYAHENNYRELAAVIRADYVLVGEVDEARIYRRRAARAP